MFGYKRSISVFASKAGSWLITLCQISPKKVSVKQLKKKKNIYIYIYIFFFFLIFFLSHFAMQNFKEFRSFTKCHKQYCEKIQGIQRKITVHVGQGRTSGHMNVLDLWPLRWHCIRNWCCGVNITTWAQEYFRKLLTLNSLLLHQEMQLDYLLL